MTITFLKSNFKSMNMSEEEKKKLAERKAKFDQSANELRKKMAGAAVGEKEMELLNKSIPKNILSLNAMKKLLEEDK